MTAKNRTLKHYFDHCELRQIQPTFYHSLAYLEICGAECREENGWLWIQDDEWILFPPICVSSGMPGELPPGDIWCAPWEKPHAEYSRAFLDYMYIFNPVDFNDMSGGGWQVFRKNSRKWPKRHEKWRYTPTLNKPEDALNLIARWMESRVNTLQDAEVIAMFAHYYDSPLIQRRYIYEGARLKAINTWDENYKYINFRLCLTVDESFLQEFARLLFYTDPEVQHSGKFVNDGGVLDSPGLERFKDKMCPTDKIKLYSWIKTD